MPWPVEPPDRMSRSRRALGQSIRRLRREHGLTQRELEERCGLDQTTISRLETGIDVKLRLARLVVLLDVLGVDRITLRSRYEGASLAGFMRRFMADDGE